MSKRRIVFELNPSLTLDTKMFAGDPCECPMCGGTGVGDIKLTDDGSFIATEESCSSCAGTGAVFAVVTVEWRPVRK